MARLPLVTDDRAAPEVQGLFSKLSNRGAKVANVYRMVAHSPAATPPFMRLGNALLQKAKLDPRVRELVILRVARLTGSAYEWQQHEALAFEMGVTREQAEVIADWEQRPEAFDEKEKAVLRYVDAVTKNVSADDATFAAVRGYFDYQELVELTLSIGFWGFVARVLVPLQVDLEEKAAASAADLFGPARK